MKCTVDCWYCCSQPEPTCRYRMAHRRAGCTVHSPLHTCLLRAVAFAGYAWRGDVCTLCAPHALPQGAERAFEAGRHCYLPQPTVGDGYTHRYRGTYLPPAYRVHHPTHTPYSIALYLIPRITPYAKQTRTSITPHLPVPLACHLAAPHIL